MNIALVILASLLGFAATGSGIAKFMKVPQIMESMEHVGVNASLIPLLGALEILGTLGLVLGIWMRPLGMLSAVCLALYFFGAVASASHLKAKSKVSDVIPAFMIMVIAMLVTYLEIML